jgi:hypothetical protein
MSSARVIPPDDALRREISKGIKPVEKRSQVVSASFPARKTNPGSGYEVDLPEAIKPQRTEPLTAQAFPTRSLPATRQHPSHQNIILQKSQLLSLIIGLVLGAMVVVIIGWGVALHLAGQWMVNVSDRWEDGDSRTSVFDAKLPDGKITPVKAFISNKHVALLVIPRGDTSKAHMLTGYDLTQVSGWEGDPKLAYIQFQQNPQTFHLTLTIYSSTLYVNFQRQHCEWKVFSDGKGDFLLQLPS